MNNLILKKKTIKKPERDNNKGYQKTIKKNFVFFLRQIS